MIFSIEMKFKDRFQIYNKKKAIIVIYASDLIRRV